MTDETETTEPEAPAFGIDDAKALIERMKPLRARCYDKCFTRSYQALEGAWEHTHGGFGSEEFVDIQAVYAWARKLGFEQSPDHAGFLHRCPDCANTPMFPWADRLDPQRVLDFVLTDPRCEHAFELAVLEETLRERVVVNAEDVGNAEQVLGLPSPAAAFPPLEAS